MSMVCGPLRPLIVRLRRMQFGASSGKLSLAAALHTVIQTCKADDVDPRTRISDVVARVAEDWPASRGDELMPWNRRPDAHQPVVQAA